MAFFNSRFTVLALVLAGGCRGYITGPAGMSPSPSGGTDPASMLDPPSTPNPDPTATPDPHAGQVAIIVAQGLVGRTTISCDDGLTWIANRSFDQEGSDLLCGNKTPVRCITGWAKVDA